MEVKNCYKALMGVLVCSVSLAGCASSDNLAPVVNLTPQGQQVVAAKQAPLPVTKTSYPKVQALPAVSSASSSADDATINAPAYTKKTYTVQKGDTLYSIAFLAGMDYGELAALNHIKPPYILSIGQVLQLAGNSEVAPTPPSSQTEPAASFKTIFWSPKKKAVEAAPSQTVSETTTKPTFRWRPSPKPTETLPNHATWQWPIKGRVISGYSTVPGGNRGLNIAGSYGAPIKAAAAGQVVYSGNGIRGYGNIIILKNTRHFLSAYAFNANNLVHDGEWVKQGQVIATMGRNLAGQVMLHFEIRFYGKAIDPMRYLPRDK